MSWPCGELARWRRDRTGGRRSRGGDRPALTVLMPCWNAAGSIQRSIASVLDEREVTLECVVIDDGSTDGTADVVAAIARRDPRVVLVRLATNGGVSNARNEGLAVARGEWLAFLDADDRLLPGGIAALMRPTADPAVRAVIGQRIWTDGEKTWLSPVYDIPDIREPGRKSIASHPGLIYYASATGKVLQRSLTTGLAFEGRVLGDQPWTIRALLRADGAIEVIGDTVYEWSRPHPDRPVVTIGSATRASASRAAEMADVARTAFTEVRDEADANLLRMRPPGGRSTDVSRSIDPVRPRTDRSRRDRTSATRTRVRSSSPWIASSRQSHPPPSRARSWWHPSCFDRRRRADTRSRRRPGRPTGRWSSRCSARTVSWSVGSAAGSGRPHSCWCGRSAGRSERPLGQRGCRSWRSCGRRSAGSWRVPNGPPDAWRSDDAGRVDRDPGTRRQVAVVDGLDRRRQLPQTAGYTGPATWPLVPPSCSDRARPAAPVRASMRGLP